MCAINGIYNYQHLNSREQVLKMNQISGHRGPDHTAIYEDEDIVLGHNRLAIIDLNENANQPFYSANDQVILVFNGEIYNFKELKRKLNSYQFKTNSDTEVFLAAYLKWGIDFVNHLNGMFAFGLWDKKERRFILGRDRMGIKPLYFSEINNAIAFSSELRSLLACDLVERKIDHEALVDYLYYATVHAPNTIINNVKVLLPGHLMIFNDDDSKMVRYWDIRKIVKSSSEIINEKEAHKQIKDLFQNAVQKRLISDVPYGAFLSGGIDSSAVVAAASRSDVGKIKTFSVVFDDQKYNEGKYAQLVAQRYQTEHNEVNLNPTSFLKDLPAALSSMDHPSGDGPNSYVVSKAAKQCGVTVALSGLGGDELFGGYDIFKRAHQLNDKKWLFSFPPGLRSVFGNFLKTIKPTVSSEKIAEIISQKYLELPYYYHINRKYFSERSVQKMLNRTNLPLAYPFKFAKDEIDFDTSGFSLPFFSKISYLEMNTYMQNVLLRDTDQMSMAHSLEVRVPFLDHDLVEYVYGLKDDLKLSKSPKKLLIDSLEGWLPEKVVNRPKMGFVLPWADWMKNELLDFNQEQLLSLTETGLINKQQIEDLLKRFIKNDPRVPWSRIWSLVVLGNWLNKNKVEV